MKNMMILAGLLSILILSACHDSRVIPTPVEQTRPTFTNMVAPVDSAFSYDRSAAIQLRFDEPMDPASFPGNFMLYEDEEKTISVNGTFSAVNNDIIFQPAATLLPAHEYFAKLRARVKDVNGNGIDKDTLLVTETEFITDGTYSQNGMPDILISNGSEDILTKIMLQNNKFVADTAADISGFGRQLEMAFTLDGSKLIMSDYNSSNSKIYFYDADTYQLEKTIDTNFDGSAIKKSAEIVVSTDKAYVVNQTAKGITVIDLASETATAFIALPNVPKGMAILPDYSKIYVGSAKDNSIWIVNTSDNTVEKTLTIVDYKYSARLAASPGGDYILAREFRGSKLAFINVADGSVTTVMDLGYEAKSGNNSDLAVNGDYVYLSSSTGELSRVQISTQTLDKQIVHVNFQGLEMFNSGDFLVAAQRDAPAKLLILNPETLQIFREIPFSGTAPWDVAIRPMP